MVSTGIAPGKLLKNVLREPGYPSWPTLTQGKSTMLVRHRLRDAFAVHAMKLDDSGDGLRLLQEHLGHVSFNTTAKYRKVAGEELKDWYNRLWKKEVKPDGPQTQ